jgi:hypothetical protein
LNWGHADFQSAALPTELSRRNQEFMTKWSIFHPKVFIIVPLLI